jgi:protein tyrosine/serine phosphatase
MRKSLALAFVLLLSFTSKSFAQSYSELEPLNESQAVRLESVTTLGKDSKLGADAPVSNFGTVDKNLYRSAAPKGLAEYKALAKMGVKTVLNFQNDKATIATEAGWAKAVGIKYISIPLSGVWAPKDADTDRIQKILNDKSQRPLLFHCTHGMERAGVQAALYRVFSMGWTAKDAYAEMKGYGFHSIDFPMKEYFEKKTNSDR